MSARIKTTNDAISVTNNMLKTVDGFIQDKELHAVLLSQIKAIVPAGELIKCILDLVTPKRPDPVMLKLFELEKQIHKLEEKINQQFAEMKAFITEHHFYSECVQPAATMMKFLRDVTSNPCHHSLGIFKANSHNPTPLACAYKVISFLEQDSTNPLKMAMRADPLQKIPTFNKWRGIFLDVLNKLLYLESMVNGMFWDKNMYGPNQLAERIVQFNGLMRQWEMDYRKNQKMFWPRGVENLIHSTQDHYQHVGNEPKANILQQEIDKILTNDSFYIIVYNDCGSYAEHSFYAEEDQTIYSFRRGKCNVVVYRSLQMNDGHSQTPKDLKKMELQVESCRHDTVPCRHTFEGFPGTLMSSRVNNARFMGMIRKNHNVVIRSVNSWREWGPGWWITAHTSLHQNPRFHDGKVPAWILIAGYK